MVKKSDEDSGHVIEETPRGGNDTVGGKIQMNEDVVETIAGLAARAIPGIHSLGKSRLITFGGDDPRRGISAEVGAKEAALDLDLVIEHGCNIREVADELRSRVATEVQRMAGRKVVEVNLNVVAIHIEDKQEGQPRQQSRVR